MPTVALGLAADVVAGFQLRILYLQAQAEESAAHRVTVSAANSSYNLRRSNELQHPEPAMLTVCYNIRS